MHPAEDNIRTIDPERVDPFRPDPHQALLRGQFLHIDRAGNIISIRLDGDLILPGIEISVHQAKLYFRDRLDEVDDGKTGLRGQEQSLFGPGGRGALCDNLRP